MKIEHFRKGSQVHEMEQLNLFGMPEMFLGDYHRAIKRGDWEALPGIVSSLDNATSDC